MNLKEIRFDTTYAFKDCSAEKLTRHSIVLLLCLVSFSAEQSLSHEDRKRHLLRPIFHDYKDHLRLCTDFQPRQSWQKYDFAKSIFKHP